MNLEEELVSVVIPVYNSEKFLKESIESILNQTWKNIEIIAIDDGSTDKSLEILNQFSDKISIISQTNQGLAAALNSSIKLINGKMFKWFSPDDLLYPNTIEILVTEAKKRDENSIIYSNWEIIDENNNTLRDFTESNYNDLSNFEFCLRLLDGQQINVNTSLIPSLLFEQNCVFEELADPVAIDYDFFLKAAIIHKTNFHLIEKKLLRYRIHSEQLSHKSISNTLNYLSVVKNNVLSKLEPSEKSHYEESLEKFRKEKPAIKKTLDLGLKIAMKLPTWFSDPLLIFYLNNIRRSR